MEDGVSTMLSGSYRTEIINEIKRNIEDGRIVRIDMTEYIPKNLPTIAKTPKPPSDELLKHHKSRMEHSQMTPTTETQ